MMNLVTSSIYWILFALWLTILVLYLGNLRAYDFKSKGLKLLLAILALDAFRTAFGLEKSNGELRKQFITSGSVQLNGEKLTDPILAVSPVAGDVLKLSKKHAVRLV